MGDEEMGIQMGLGEGVLFNVFSWRSIVGSNICFLRSSLVEGQSFPERLKPMGHPCPALNLTYNRDLFGLPPKKETTGHL